MIQRKISFEKQWKEKGRYLCLTNNMKNIYVTGFIGSDRYSLGKKLAGEKGMKLLVLDDFIEQIDGRSVMRIIMLMGEHEYRNKEYEALEELSKREDLVVVCGDGALFDEMCRELMEQDEIIIADADKTADELWLAAKDDRSIPYAFMQLGSEDEKKKLSLRCTGKEKKYMINIFDLPFYGQIVYLRHKNRNTQVPVFHNLNKLDRCNHTPLCSG